MACTTDFDCPTTLICYSAENAGSWYYDHYGADAANSTCDCATWYGWTGDDCLELSMPTYVHLTMQIFTATVALIGALVGIHVLWRVYRVDRESRFFTAGNITAIYCTVALLAMFAWRVINVVMFLRPDLYDLRLDGDDDKLTQLTAPDRAVTAITAAFATLCALNVSLMWLQVADESKRFRRQVAYLTTYRKIIIAFETLFTLAIVLVMALNMPFYATLVSYPFIIFVFVTYAIGQHKMTRLLNGMDTSAKAGSSSKDNEASAKGSNKVGPSSQQNTSASGDRRYKQMLRLIRNTSRAVVLSGFIVLVFGGLYAALAFNWKEYAPVGKVSIVTLSNDIFVLGILGVMVSVQWYIWRMLGSRVRRLAQTGSSELQTRQDDNSFTNTGSFKVQMPGQVNSFTDPKRFKQQMTASFHNVDEQDSAESSDDYV